MGPHMALRAPSLSNILHHTDMPLNWSLIFKYHFDPGNINGWIGQMRKHIWVSENAGEFYGMGFINGDDAPLGTF